MAGVEIVAGVVVWWSGLKEGKEWRWKKISGTRMEVGCEMLALVGPLVCGWAGGVKSAGLAF